MEVNLQVPFGSRGRSDFGKRETEGGEKACTPRTGPRGEADGADPSANFTDRLRKGIRGIFGRAAVADRRIGLETATTRGYSLLWVGSFTMTTTNFALGASSLVVRVGDTAAVEGGGFGWGLGWRF